MSWSASTRTMRTGYLNNVHSSSRHVTCPSLEPNRVKNRALRRCAALFPSSLHYRKHLAPLRKPNRWVQLTKGLWFQTGEFTGSGHPGKTPHAVSVGRNGGGCSPTSTRLRPGSGIFAGKSVDCVCAWALDRLCPVTNAFGEHSVVSEWHTWTLRRQAMT